MIGRWLCRVFLCLLPCVAAAETVRLGSFQIPLLVESADSGMFVDVARAVAQQVGVDLEVVFLPTQRTRELFERGEVDGYFPALASSLNTPHAASIPFSTKRVYAFTLAGKTVPSSAAEFKGLQIGITEGFTYPQALLNVDGAFYQATNTDPQNLAKLLAGRIDVFLGDEISTLEAIRQAGAQGQVAYDSHKALAVYPIFFAFTDTPRGHSLAGRFSAAIRVLNEQGVISRILSQP